MRQGKKLRIVRYFFCCFITRERNHLPNICFYIFVWEKSLANLLCTFNLGAIKAQWGFILNFCAREDIVEDNSFIFDYDKESLSFDIRSTSASRIDSYRRGPDIFKILKIINNQISIIDFMFFCHACFARLT